MNTKIQKAFEKLQKKYAKRNTDEFTTYSEIIIKNNLISFGDYSWPYTQLKLNFDEFVLNGQHVRFQWRIEGDGSMPSSLDLADFIPEVKRIISDFKYFLEN